MTRWDDRWSRAKEAAAVARMRTEVDTVVAVDRDLAAVLDVSDDAARLLLLRRDTHGFEPWAEPIVEPLRGFFAAIVARVPAEGSELVLSGIGPDDSGPLWSLRLPATNLLSGV